MMIEPTGCEKLDQKFHAWLNTKDSCRRQALKISLADLSMVEFDETKSEDLPNSFEKAKAHKSTMEAAINEFNRKPGKGIEYLLSNQLVDNSPSLVAQFLRNTPTLDKAEQDGKLTEEVGFLCRP